MKKRKIKVFIATPSDLTEEREAFRNILELLNEGFGDGANIEFEALGWENEYASTGRRVQSLFNKMIDECDVFILAMHTRWGQTASDAAPYSSYTEEEFYRAYDRFREQSKPEIFVFFKQIERALEAHPDEQLQKVLDFRKKLEESGVDFYKAFKDVQQFKTLIGRHLRAYVKGDLTSLKQGLHPIILPLDVVKEIEAQKKEVQLEVQNASMEKDQALLQLELRDLKMAEFAAALSFEGKIEYARQMFSIVSLESKNLKILNLSFLFYQRTGDLDAADAVLQKWDDLLVDNKNTIEGAAVTGNKGIILLNRGKTDEAQKCFQHALSIYETEIFLPGLAQQFGNLGVVNQIQSKYKLSERFFFKALDIHKSLNQQRFIGADYLNLGDVYSELGQLDMADKMYLKAEKVFKEINSQEGIAKVKSNHGHVYKIKGEYLKAIAMYEEAAIINSQLGSIQGEAIQYSSLANIYRKMRDFKKSKFYFTKAIEINEKFGFIETLASNYGNLSLLNKDMGLIDEAEELALLALTLHREVNSQSGVAAQYSNLAVLSEKREEINKAMEFHHMSMEINSLIGHRQNLAVNYGNLAGLHLKKNELVIAEEFYKKSIDLALSVGDKENLGNQYSNLGDLYLLTEDIDNAIKMFTSSKQAFFELNSSKFETVDKKLKFLTS